MSATSSNGNPQSVADFAERARAMDVASSVVVQAPAGSGKTELLVQRFLALLATVDRPESILAITFTRKAAAEMRERILAALRAAERGEEAAGGGAAEQRLRLARAALEHGRRWNLADSPGRLQVFTIDGLNARLAAAMPLLGRLGGAPATIEDPTPLYRLAARRCLYGEARQSDAVLAECIDTVLERYEMGVAGLEQRLVEMLARREQWTHVASAVLDSPEILLERIELGFAAALGECTQTLAGFFSPELREMVHEVARATRAALASDGIECKWPTLGAQELLGDHPSSIGAWVQARALLMTGKTVRKRLDVNLGAKDPAVKQRYRMLLDEIEVLPERRLAELRNVLASTDDMPASGAFSGDSRAAMLALLRVLLHVHAELWLVFRERRQVDFVQIATGALTGLGSADQPSELLQRLDSRYSHLLVDEFQDTSLLQCELVAKLTEGWTAGEGRTLYLVGDPMQSIYRFRKAEVGLFLGAYEGRLFHHARATPVRLEVNFRSERLVLDWINRVFSSVLGDVDDARRGIVKFAPSVARPGAGEGDPVTLRMWRRLGDDDEGGQGEARALGALLATQLLPAARARGGRLAILVRARRHALALLEQLRARGIRYRAPGFDRLANRASVSDLASLTRAIVHPADRLSWMALLRAPMVGLTLSDLLLLFEPDVAAARAISAWAPPRVVAAALRDEQATARVSDDGRARIERAAQILEAARHRLGSVPVERIVRGAWIALGGPACADTEGVLDAEQFFALLPACTERGAVDLDDLERRLEELEASVDPDPSIDVEVMTIHKAKGLQFDTVVLPGLDRLARGDGQVAVTMETDAATGQIELMAPAPARGRAQDDDDAKHSLLKRRERERGAAELRRMLYVAATRAEHCLLLSATAPKDGKEPANGTALAVLLPALAPGDIVVEDCPVLEAVPARPSMRVSSTFRVQPPAVVVQPRTVEIKRPSEAAAEQRTDVEMATSLRAVHIGKAAHAAVERITADGVGAWSAERVRSERAWIERKLRAAGAVAEDLDGCIEAVEDTLVKLLSDERGLWILGDHAEARTELALTGLEASAITNASIDRTFVDAGARWVVDLKTGRPDPNSREYRGKTPDQAACAYVDARVAEYAAQLEAYRTLLRGARAELPSHSADLPVRLGLYFARLPAPHRWREVGTETQGASVDV